jgi:hypothetical protein
MITITKKEPITASAKPVDDIPAGDTFYGFHQGWLCIKTDEGSIITLDDGTELQGHTTVPGYIPVNIEIVVTPR